MPTSLGSTRHHPKQGGMAVVADGLCQRRLVCVCVCLCALLLFNLLPKHQGLRVAREEHVENSFTPADHSLC